MITVCEEVGQICLELLFAEITRNSRWFIRFSTILDCSFQTSKVSAYKPYCQDPTDWLCLFTVINFTNLLIFEMASYAFLSSAILLLYMFVLLPIFIPQYLQAPPRQTVRHFICTLMHSSLYLFRIFWSTCWYFWFAVARFVHILIFQFWLSHFSYHNYSDTVTHPGRPSPSG